MNGESQPAAPAAPAPLLRRLSGTGVLLLIAIACAWGAAGMMFSTFMYYDDEGYLLCSYRNYVEHGSLYREVFSQYGPAPYVWHDLLNRAFGFPLTHAAGRVLTLVLWLGTAGLLAALVRRRTGSVAAAAFTLAGTVAYLWHMVSEPSHPGGLATALTAAGAAGGALLWADGRLRSFAVLNGAVAAILLLTKINVGAFYALSWLAFVALQGVDGIPRRAALRACLLALVLLPGLLMFHLLDRPWVLTYALFFSLGGIAAAAAACRVFAVNGGDGGMAPGKIPVSTILWSGGAALLAGGLIIAAVCAHGSSLADIWRGVVVEPLRLPAAYSSGFKWRMGAWPAMLLSLSLLAWVAWRSRGAPPESVPAGVSRLLAWIRLAAIPGTLVLFCCFPAASPSTWFFSYLHAMLWILLWPLEQRPGDRWPAARVWLWLVLLLQSLQPFPIPGSQVGFGTCLAVPLLVLAWMEALEWLPARDARLRRLPAAGALLLGGMAVAATFNVCSAGMKLYRNEPLNLRGTAPLRLDPATISTYHALTTNATMHGDMLFSLPGMFSLNLWTGLPTPTLANTTQWSFLLSQPQQQAVIDALAQHPRAVVVVNRAYCDRLASAGIPQTGLLCDYLDREFVPAFRVGEYEFCVHRGRTAAPFLTGRFLFHIPQQGETGQSTGRLELVLPPMPGVEIHSFEVCCVRGRDGRPLRLDAGNCRAIVQSIDPGGNAVSGVDPCSLPLRPSHPVLFVAEFPLGDTLPDPLSPVVKAMDSGGHVAAFIRLTR